MTNGWRNIFAPGGVPVQQSTTVDERQYSHNRARPLLGIVWEVFPADHPSNLSALRDPSRRGVSATCSCIIINDGAPCCYFLSNVVIPPRAVSGLDDFEEHLPRPSTQLTTGATLPTGLRSINVHELDGDWVIIQFIGNNQELPYISNYWPHPKNSYDPATSGKGNPNRSGRGRALIQHERYFRRTNGVEHVVTKTGDIYLSTRRTNSQLRMGDSATDGRWPRTTDEEDGGSVHVAVKPSQLVEMTWRTQPDGMGVAQTSEPELPQPNPKPTSGNQDVQDTENTYILIDKQTVRMETDTVRFKASGIISLLSEDSLTVSVENDIDVSCGSATITVDTALDLGGSEGNTLIDSRWKTAWDSGISAVVAVEPTNLTTAIAAIEAIQLFLQNMQVALASSVTTKTKAV